MGARLIRDLNPAGSSSPESIISIDGLLFFTADLGSGSTTKPPTGEDTSEPDNDSSEDGNENNSEESSNSNVNDNTADDSDQAIGQGLALIKSDGTSEGTKVLKEFQSINNLVEVNGELYFIADDGSGNRLWRSDGTARGTVLVKDLYPGADPNFPQDLFEIDGVLFYSAIDGTEDDGKYPYVNGYEVWRREGEGVGSRFFRNLIPDRIITEIQVEDDADPISELILDENGNPIELTTTTTINTVVGNDGFTTTTTTIDSESYINGDVKKTSTTDTERTPTDPRNITTTNVTEEISLSTGVTPQVPLKKTTTVTQTVNIEAGLTTTTTVVVEDMEINGVVQTETTTSSEQVAFTPVDLNSTTVQIEKSYAVEIGQPAEITTTTYENDSFPGDFVGINGNYFFTAQSSALYSLDTKTSDTVIGGLELWFSDGTEGGTRPINVNENVYSFYEPEDGEYSTIDISKTEFGFKQTASSSFPRELTKFDDQLVLVANDGISGFELWTVSAEGDSLRQVANLAEGSTSSSPEELTVVGNRLYFTADDGTGRKLWSITQDLGTPTLVSGGGTEPRQLTAIQGELYFSARSQLGRELWVADGNSANLVEDINPGTGSSSPANFTAIENQRKGGIETQLFFTADGGERGVELWSLDLAKNSSKPQRYDDIVDGPTSSEPRQLVNAEQRLYFTADDGESGRELWTLGVTIQGPSGSTDGESSAAIQVEEQTKKVFQYSSDSDVAWSLNGGDDSDLFAINKKGWLKFNEKPYYDSPVDSNRDNIYQVRIRAKDQRLGTTSDQLVDVKVIILNSGTDLENGTDGDGENNPGNEDKLITSTLIKNINPGQQSSNPNHLKSLKNEVLLFAADNGKKGNELWSSKGSKTTTSVLKDINKGFESSNPSEFTNYKSQSYFSADDGKKGQELWVSNGKKKGTELVSDVNPGAAGSFPSDLLVVDQRLFFSADDGKHGRELWSYSTQHQTSSLVLDIQTKANIGSNPGELTNVNGQIMFAADDQIYGRELWISDGTGSGTRLLDDINPGGLSSNPRNLSVLNGKLYFTAESYLLGGRQVFRLDNQNNDGTTVLVLEEGENTGIEPSDLHASRDQLFFTAETTFEPTPSAPSIDESSNSASDPGGFMVATDGIEAEAIEYVNQYNEGIDEYRKGADSEFYLDDAKFWANQLLNSNLVNSNDSSLAEDWNQYFQSSSNSSPIQIPGDLPSNAAKRSSTTSPGNIAVTPDAEGINNNLGRELWVSNGEADGHQLLKDIAPGAGSSNPRGFHTIGSKTYFSADDGVNGEELWVTDGTVSGTYLVSDINKGTGDSSPRSINDLDGRIYFSAKTDQYGRELWRLDDTQKKATRIVSSGAGKKKLRALEDNANEFRFELAGQFGKRQADRITGFDQTEGDQLALGRDVFDGLTDIDLVTVTSKTQLATQSGSSTALIYFEPRGQLYFNQNGDESGYGEDGGLFAILKGGPDLSDSAFRII